MICKNCGEETDSKYLCPHCSEEYKAENNYRYDIKPITEDVINSMFEKYNKLKRDMYDRLNRGI